LKIVPSCPLGSLVLDGEAALYAWHWWYSVAGMGLWIVLVLAMVVPRANRTWKTLLILVPVATVSLEWLVFSGIVGGRPSEIRIFGVIAHSLAVGSAVLWLLGHWLAGRAWHRTFLRSLGLTVGVTLVGTLSLGVANDRMLIITVVLTLMMIAMVLAYALAVRGYRVRGDRGFFTLHAAGSMVACLVGTFLAAPIFLLITGSSVPSIGSFLKVVVPGGLLLGLLVFLVVLPFGILGVSSTFFRQRLILCLGGKPAEGPDRHCDHPDP